MRIPRTAERTQDVMAWIFVYVTYVSIGSLPGRSNESQTAQRRQDGSPHPSPSIRVRVDLQVEGQIASLCRHIMKDKYYGQIALRQITHIVYICTFFVFSLCLALSTVVPVYM